jgi:microcystin-dependent protein
MEPFLGEIRLFSFGRAPNGWLACNGQVLNINAYQALYALLGNLYGGSAPTTFALPDLRGRVPVAQGPQDPALGAKNGVEGVALTTASTPLHTHTVKAYSTAADSINPNSAYPAVVTVDVANSPPAPNMFIPTVPGGTASALNTAMIKPTGAGQAHENRQPYLAMNYCIASSGLFPQRQ